MQIGFNLLFKPKYDSLACGLFGAAAGDVSKININKLKILGIYNDIRGGHSCGMSIDGDIILGTNKDKLFKDFISTCNIDAPQVLPVVLGHTRMATGGTHNEDNAHPFGFGSNGDYYDFVGTHNGTLHNEDDLAKEYEVSTKSTSFKNGKAIIRNKIDSEILLEIIYENGFKVLEKYEGAAALAMYNTKKPNTLYLYHGASSKVANGEAVEERPLFYYQESENVVYYSSLKNSLEAINDTGAIIEEFKHNIVYEIRNGNVAKAKQLIINRSKCTQTNSNCSYTKNYYDYSKNNTNCFAKEWDNTKRTWVDKKETNHTLFNILHHNAQIYLSGNNDFKDTVYYENLRFYQNKKLLDGIYVLDKNFNLVRICSYYFSFNVIYKEIAKENLFFDNIVPLYFIDGVRIDTDKDYQILQDTFKTFNISQLSHCSVYPICDINNEEGLIYHKGNVCTNTFAPLFVNYIYKIINGSCKEITKLESKSTSSYFKEDIELLLKLKEHSKVITLETKEISDDEICIELYKENLLATVEYCKEDCDDSISNNYVQNQIKSKLNQIEKFVTKLLTI